MSTFVIDSCVLLAAVKPEESGHAVAAKLFHAAERRGDKLLAAATILWDLAGALNHPAKRRAGAPFSPTFKTNVSFVPIDAGLFARWPTVQRVPMKGPDLIVLAVALDSKVPLISSDPDMLNYGTRYGVAVLSPEQYLGAQS